MRSVSTSFEAWSVLRHENPSRAHSATALMPGEVTEAVDEEREDLFDILVDVRSSDLGIGD